MVNKIRFGKRISMLRRNIGLSQVELVEKHSIISQAVSKWKCGSSHSKDITPDIATPRVYITCFNKVNCTDNSELKYRIIRFAARLDVRRLTYGTIFANVILILDQRSDPRLLGKMISLTSVF